MAKNNGAPNVGAFYFEDAVARLKESGCTVGRVEITEAPVRESKQANEPVRENKQAQTAADKNVGIFSLPQRRYRVILNRVTGFGEAGEPVCDLLITPAPYTPLITTGD